MKKLLALLLALAVMLCALPALAAEGAADITFEGTVYHLTLERAEIVDGQLNVAVSGFGNSLPMRNGSFIIIAWAAAVVDGAIPDPSALDYRNGELRYAAQLRQGLYTGDAA